MASTLYDAGVDIKSAQKFLGHSDIQVTLKIYTHLSEGKEQAAVDALNKHLGARGEKFPPVFIRCNLIMKLKHIFLVITILDH